MHPKLALLLSLALAILALPFHQPWLTLPLLVVAVLFCALVCPIPLHQRLRRGVYRYWMKRHFCKSLSSDPLHGFPVMTYLNLDPEAEDLYVQYGHDLFIEKVIIQKIEEAQTTIKHAVLDAFTPYPKMSPEQRAREKARWEKQEKQYNRQLLDEAIPDIDRIEAALSNPANYDEYGNFKGDVTPHQYEMADFGSMVIKKPEVSKAAPRKGITWLQVFAAVLLLGLLLLAILHFIS